MIQSDFLQIFCKVTCFNHTFPLTGRKSPPLSTYLTVAFSSDSVMHKYRKTAVRLTAKKRAKWKMMFAQATCENIPFGFIITERLSSLNKSPKRPSGYHVIKSDSKHPVFFISVNVTPDHVNDLFWDECLISCQWSFVKWQCWHGCELTSVKLKAQKHTHKRRYSAPDDLQLLLLTLSKDESSLRAWREEG